MEQLSSKEVKKNKFLKTALEQTKENCNELIEIVKQNQFQHWHKLNLDDKIMNEPSQVVLNITGGEVEDKENYNTLMNKVDSIS